MEPRYLLQGGPDGPEAVGVAYRLRPRWRPWVRPRWLLDRLPWPVPGAPGEHDERVRGLVRAALSDRCAAIELGSFDGPSPPPPLAQLGFSVEPRFEFAVDLSRSEEDLLAAMKSSHRRKVRQAGRAGVVVREEREPGRIAVLGRLQDQTRERRGRRGEDMSCPPESRYQLLATCLLEQGRARLYVGTTGDGEEVSAVLIDVHGDRAYYLMGGTDSRGLAVNAASLVMWEAVRALRAEGLAELNLGGVPQHAEASSALEHGLYRFKDGWGGERRDCLGGVWTRAGGPVPES
jgi:hypothetical protein